MPDGARSSASPFANPTSPALEALYAVSPSRGRSPSTEPVKISRPPSRITRAAARAPRNAPVRFTSSTWRQTDGGVSSGPATMGEIPALQIHTSIPPHSADGRVGDCLVELLVGHVAAADECGTRELVGDAS